MIKININAHSRYPVARKKLRQELEQWLNKQGLEAAELTIKIAGDRMMRRVNKQFRGKDAAAAVLAFPLEGKWVADSFPVVDKDEDNGGKNRNNWERLYLGDLLISYPQAVLQAVAMNVLVDERIIVLAKHGLKHLLGISNS